MAKSIFSEFTNKYSLSKTLRFELKPVGNTEKMLIDNDIFRVDKHKFEAYKQVKPYFDRLHRQFIQDSLTNVNINFEHHFDLFKKFRSDKIKHKKEFEKSTKNLRKEIVEVLNSNAKEWTTNKYVHIGFKSKDCGFLREEQVFTLLKELFGEDKSTLLTDTETGEVFSIFDQWKGFTGYFGKFYETRTNLYKDDGTSTALATRIIDQNLSRFLDNIFTFESIKDKLDFSEVEEFFEVGITEVFSLNYYKNCLLQDGINTYNDFLGGKTLENGEKKKGINEIINKYRQDNKGEKLPFLKKLDKQILSEKEVFLDEIQDNNDLLKYLNEFYDSAKFKVNIVSTLFKDLLENTANYNLSGVFLSKEAINTISHRWTSMTDLFNENLYLMLKDSKIVSNSSRKKDGSYSFPDFVSLDLITKSLEKIDANVLIWKDKYYIENVVSTQDSKQEQFLKIFYFEFSTLLDKATVDQNGTSRKTGYLNAKRNLEQLLNDFYLNSDTKLLIKEFADSVLQIYQLSKYFALEKKRSWVSEFDDQLDEFYTKPEKGYLEFHKNAYEEVVQPYNKIRNFLTKKPYSEEKWKLNFNNPTLAKGWDKNKESDNNTVILRKDNKYYLGIMKKGCSQLFSDKNKSLFRANSEESSYEKLVYKLFPDPAKMMPKVCFSAKGLEFFRPSSEILDIYNNAEFKKGDTFSISSMQRLIEFYILALSQYDGWKHYDFKFVKSPSEYNDNISEFYRDVAISGYKIWFEPLSEVYINEKNKNGELFLFQIYNKDYSNDSTGSRNLHTLYFEELFSQQNSESNFPIKLNGEAELFYRPKSIEAETEKRNFKRDIFVKKRYTQNKVFFHVPITLNRTPENVKFNIELNNFLANNPDINVIGVDRGEKHLAYYSVIDQQGNLIESDTLNKINGVDYHQKLTVVADKREQARKDWQDVEGIKNLKKGYISQVVRKLADLAVQHNAIIVMEDLNMRFKQIRGGIEKSIYQQLEKALIDKLSYLVNKNEVDPTKAGHLLNAYQLTQPITTFKEMGKQTGIIFYTQASYTSKIDPLTGWRPNLYLKYSNSEKAKSDILKFKNIDFKNNRFEFVYDLKDFINSKEYPNKTEWTLCSSVERFRWNKSLNQNKGGYDHYKDLTHNFQDLFISNNIDFTRDIIGQIDQLQTQGNEKFFKDFIFYFNLICQIRNTQSDKDGNENDFILSPVEPFFDTRKSEHFKVGLPKNGDENGAYNIARKGIIILNKISDFISQKSNTKGLKTPNLFISHKEWDNFATNSN